MKTYVINIADKLGTSIHPQAYLSHQQAFQECHRMADDYMNNLIKNGILTSKDEMKEQSKVHVRGKDSVLCSYLVKEVELDITPVTSKIEVMP